MRTAFVLGHRGRVGKAFYDRLVRDGYHVVFEEPKHFIDGLLIFDCRWQDHGVRYHVFQVARLLDYYCGTGSAEAIFIPSSWHIGTDTDYGRAKFAIEALARFYNGFGEARVVIDRIGYFPGDHAAPNPKDEFIDRLVTGDELYDRVMAKMLPPVVNVENSTQGICK